MNDFNFTPTEKEATIEVPYFEDASADFAPYYRSRKTIARAKAELTAELGKLGAGIVAIQEGYFGSKHRRYGYRILFVYHGRQGVINVAGLPIKGTHTTRKVEQVRLQALLVAVDWWKAAITQRVFSPGTDVLMMHLLVDEKRTVADYIREAGSLPQLTAGDVVEGEWEAM